MRKSKVHPIIHSSPLLKNGLKSPFRKLLSPHRRVLILGPLQIPHHRLKESMKNINPTMVIYVDGGIKHKKKISLHKNVHAVSVGDGDSSQNRLDFLLPQKKDFSDLAFVLAHLHRDIEQVSLLGFSGSQDDRLDHFLINLGEIESFVQRKKIHVTIDDCFHLYPAGKNSFEVQGTFSILSLRHNSIKISGKAQYQLRNWTKLAPLSSLGLSNQGHGRIVTESKGPILIYIAGVN